MTKKGTGIYDVNGKEVKEGDRVIVDDTFMGVVKKHVGEVGPCKGINVSEYILEDCYDITSSFTDPTTCCNLWQEVEIRNDISENKIKDAIKIMEDKNNKLFKETDINSYYVRCIKLKEALCI